jgi:short-subunit dehydrogenase
MYTNLKDKLVVVTGVGIKPVDHIFKDINTGEPSHTPIHVDSEIYKANIGAAVSFELCKAGASVLMIARTEEKLKTVKTWIKDSIPQASIEYIPVDLADESAVKTLVSKLPKDKEVYWVQCVGLGGGTVKVKDDNPYLTIENISPELIEVEMTVLRDTVSFLQALLPQFRKQKETRVCIVSSMSAVRSVPGGSIHNAAKGAISRFANAAMIELHKENIFITDVRPGGVDTGLYDSKIVQDSIIPMAASYGTDWTKEIRLAPPSSVAKIIVQILDSEAHISSVNLVARGQFPHEGS